MELKNLIEQVLIEKGLNIKSESKEQDCDYTIEESLDCLNIYLNDENKIQTCVTILNLIETEDVQMIADYLAGKVNSIKELFDSEVYNWIS